MAGSSLVLHRGAQQVTPEELLQYRAPPPNGRWHPIAHCRVLEAVSTTLRDAGYAIRDQRLGVMRDGSRFFGTLTLDSRLADGVSLAVGVRNSVDKSFPLGFCAGSRVFVCDNLAFRSELLVRRKHTRFGEQRFVTDIAHAVSQLDSFKESESNRIAALKVRELSSDVADALILRSFERGIVNSLYLPRVISEWRQPSHGGDYHPHSAWGLLNAFTQVLGDRAVRAPAEYAVQTMRLNALLDPPRLHETP